MLASILWLCLGTSSGLFRKATWESEDQLWVGNSYSEVVTNTQNQGPSSTITSCPQPWMEALKPSFSSYRLLYLVGVVSRSVFSFLLRRIVDASFQDTAYSLPLNLRPNSTHWVFVPLLIKRSTNFLLTGATTITPECMTIAWHHLAVRVESKHTLERVCCGLTNTGYYQIVVPHWGHAFRSLPFFWEPKMWHLEI